MKHNCSITLLLDIDGVISPLTSNSKDSVTILNDWGNWSISKNIIEFIYYLSFIGVRIIWISSHEESSNNIMRYLDLPESEYIEFEDEISSWQKKHSLLKEINKIIEIEGAGHRIVLIDDEIPVSMQLDLQLLGVQTLVPDGRYGLLKEDIESIKKFIAFND